MASVRKWRSKERHVVHQHEVECRDLDDDLDLLDADVFACSIGQFLEGAVCACLAVDSNDLGIDDERVNGLC